MSLTTSPSVALSTWVATSTTTNQKKKKGFGIPFWCFFTWLCFILICAVVGKRLPFAHKDPDYLTAALINDGKWSKTFSMNHILGTDQNGNDWLSAAVVGARNSMIIAFATVLFGFLLGGGLGMIAGFGVLLPNQHAPTGHMHEDGCGGDGLRCFEPAKRRLLQIGAHAERDGVSVGRARPHSTVHHADVQARLGGWPFIRGSCFRARLDGLRVCQARNRRRGKRYPLPHPTTHSRAAYLRCDPEDNFGANTA